MKFVAVFTMICALAVSLSAQENLLKNDKWKKFANTDQVTCTIDSKTGEMQFVNNAPKLRNGAIQYVVLNQTAAAPITFGGEAKCENVSAKSTIDYGLYMDIVHTDNSSTYGIRVSFPGGTVADWTKVTKTYTPAKPVKRINFYVLFRNITGKAEVRNVTLTQGK